MPTTTTVAPDRVVCPRCDAHSLPGTIACPYCHYEFRFEWSIPTHADTTTPAATQELDAAKPDARSLRASGILVSVLSFIAGMVTLALLQSALRP